MKPFVCNRGHKDNYREYMKPDTKTGKHYKMRQCIDCININHQRNKHRRPSYHSNFMFGGNREIAIKRDDSKCIKCGITREEHKSIYNRDITVDHIDGQGSHSKVKNNSLDNLQTLCLKCHGTKDYKRKKVSNYNKSMRGPVLQMKNNKVVGKFHSAAIASREISAHEVSMWQVLDGRRKSLHGYQWVYERDLTV